MAQSALQVEYIDKAGVNSTITLGGDNTPTSIAERRRAPRTQIIKSARVVFEEGNPDTVFECLVIDESRTGVLVNLGTPIDLPNNLILKITGGAVYLTRRVWFSDTRAGLEFIGDPIISEETGHRMLVIWDILQKNGLSAANQELILADFFGNKGLRQAAIDAEASFKRLNSILSCSKIT